MDDSDLAIEQALQRLDSESSDSEVNVACLNGEPGSESCSVVDSTELGDGMFSNDQFVRRFNMMNGSVNRKLNSLQNSATATKDNSSIASFSTDSDAGAKSDVYCHQPMPATKSSRMAVSDTEGSRPRKSHRSHHGGGAYLNENKWVSREEFALQLRERLYAVAKDRDTMTMKARDLLRQRGLSYEEIMSAQWYDLSEACKYLETVSDISSNAPSKSSGGLQPPPSSHHPRSPLEVHSPGRMPGLRQGSMEPGLRHGSLEHVNGMRDVEEAMRDWRVSNQAHRKRSHRQTNSGCSSVFSATSDSGVGGDTWASSELTTPTNVWGPSDLTTPSNDRLHQYLQRQNIIAARLPERERMAQSAAIALISNSPHPESLSPLPGPTHPHHHHDNERQRRHMGHHYSSGDDSSSAFTITSQSSTSDLFIPKRPPHLGADSEDQQHYPSNIYRRTLSTPKRSNHMKRGHAPSPLTEQHRQQIPSQQTQRANKGDTLIMYTLDELPTPFAKRLGGTDITLKDFKERVFARKGEYRFFFKSYCPDVKMELLEEYSDDETVLPLVQGKIEGRVEKIPL